MDNATSFFFGNGLTGGNAAVIAADNSSVRAHEPVSGADNFSAMFQENFQAPQPGGKAAAEPVSADTVAAAIVPMAENVGGNVAVESRREEKDDVKSDTREKKDSAAESNILSVLAAASSVVNLKSEAKSVAPAASSRRGNAVAIEDVSTKNRTVAVNRDAAAATAATVDATTGNKTDKAERSAVKAQAGVAVKDNVTETAGQSVKVEKATKSGNELPAAAANAAAMAETKSAVHASGVTPAAASVKKAEGSTGKNTASSVSTEDNSAKSSGKELAVSGIKIHSVTTGGNVVAASAGQSGKNNGGTADGSGTDGKNLLNTLAERSSRLQQKLQANSQAGNDSATPSESLSGVAKNAVKSAEVSAKGNVSVKTKTAMDSQVGENNPLSGLDMSRQGNNTVIRNEAQLSQTSASVLTEKIATMQQLAEKIGTTLSGQDYVKGQTLTMDLESESMGRMQMFLQQNGNSLKIVFEPGSESCRQQLQDQQEELARHLRNLGFQECSLDIADSRQQGQGQQREPEKNSSTGNDDLENVKLAGNDQSDLAQILAM